MVSMEDCGMEFVGLVCRVGVVGVFVGVTN